MACHAFQRGGGVLYHGKRAPTGRSSRNGRRTLELAVGNPLFHWSHLELQRFFGYHGVLNGETAEEVWNLCNAKLHEDGMSVRNLIRQSGVTLVCTTDDPADDLRWHQQLAADDSFEVQVLPAWRPDKAMNLEKPDYVGYLKKLGGAAGMEIGSFAALKEALKKRMAFFAEMGCRASDHALEYVMCVPRIRGRAGRGSLQNVWAGERITREEEMKFKTAFMLFVAGEYARLGWAMQLHYGCKRDNNTAMYSLLGPDTGFDCINNYAPSAQLADFLDLLNRDGRLPKDHHLQPESQRRRGDRKHSRLLPEFRRGSQDPAGLRLVVQRQQKRAC